ncbi:MAG: CPBP family intramembrane metalloprotease [Lachnospiraceae bacterium]|nr:CPBP family intramembrane metalloprotease [Lachnospiraceae bacterium]
MNENENKMRKAYMFFAIAVAVFGIAADGMQMLGSGVIAPALGIVPTESTWFPFVNIIIPMYVIGFPILFLVLRKNEVVKPEKHKLSFGKYILYIPLMAALIVVGAVIGTILNYMIVLPFGVDPQNSTAIGAIMMNSNPFWRILTAGILAPIVEEMIFRKFLIDRTYRYGEWVAIITSGLMFGLFHGNLAQFFFATLIGGLFAYIYIRTGQVWYTIGLHMILNLSTSVITMATMKPYLSVDQETFTEYQNISQQYLASGGDPALQERLMSVAGQVIPKMIPFMIWSGIISQVALAGIVLWIIFLAKKKVVIKKAPDQVEKGMKYAWGNFGMILFVLYCLVMFVINYISIIGTFGA